MKFLEQYIGTIPANVLPIVLLLDIPFQIGGFVVYSFAKKSNVWNAHLVGVLVPPLTFATLLVIIFVLWRTFSNTSNDLAFEFTHWILFIALVEGFLTNLLFAIIVQSILYWKN